MAGPLAPQVLMALMAETQHLTQSLLLEAVAVAVDRSLAFLVVLVAVADIPNQEVLETRHLHPRLKVTMVALALEVLLMVAVAVAVQVKLETLAEATGEMVLPHH